MPISEFIKKNQAQDVCQTRIQLLMNRHHDQMKGINQSFETANETLNQNVQKLIELIGAYTVSQNKINTERLDEVKAMDARFLR